MRISPKVIVKKNPFYVKLYTVLLFFLIYANTVSQHHILRSELAISRSLVQFPHRTVTLFSWEGDRGPAEK